MAPRFARHELLWRADELVAGMVSGLDRKNCWTIAKHRGSATPDGLQHLLARARWDADAVRDDPRDYVVDACGVKAPSWWSTKPATLRKAPKWLG